MRGFALGLALLGLVIDVPAGFATANRIETVHPERYRMSPSARRQAVLDDLATILAGPATPTSIATAPRAANTDLCERDVITLDYRHAKEGNPKSLFKPDGVQNVFRQYHLIGYSDELSESEAQKACRSLDRDEDYWASSDSESTARFGLATLKKVTVAVRTNQGVMFDCNALHDAAIEARCASEFLAVADQPYNVRECSELSHGAGHDCFAYDLGKYYLVTITRDWPATGGPKATVKLEWQGIIITWAKNQFGTKT